MKCWLRVAYFAAFCVFCYRAMADACPMFVEFFPDPKDVPDQEGEFVEIRLDDFVADSLVVQMDDKASLSFGFPRGKRLVLVHDSLYCPKIPEVACGLLGKLSLPNSREALWRLRAGTCSDSVLIPTPKAGKSLQRVRETGKWDFVEPTFGFANPAYEDGVADCGIGPVQRDLLAWNGDSLFRYSLFLSGCDSSALWLETMDLESGAHQDDSLQIQHRYSWESSSNSLWIQARLPQDESPGNNLLDTLFFPAATRFPLAISEIHHCPQEPEPEWVEVYNRSSVSLPLNKFRFCNRGGIWAAAKASDGAATATAAYGLAPAAGRNADSIAPYESVIMTKDTAQFREFLGFKDVRLVQVALGFLNNTAGCISICSGETVVDSVCWDRHTVTCPAGFNPLTMTAENTPGFLRGEITGGVGGNGRGAGKGNPLTPFAYRFSSRVVRRGGNPLRVYVEGEAQVTIRLLDSAGREQWRREVPSQSNVWWTVPLDGMALGVAYVSLSVGKFENVVGILIRP